METRDKMKRDSLFGKIPENWSLKEIGDVITLKQGLQISKKLRVQKEENGSVPLLKITDLPTRNYSEYVINVPSGYIANREDIIYTRTGQVGLVYTGINGCVHNNCFKVIANDKLELSKNYIYYYLNNSRFREYANSIASGSVQKDLTHTSFKKILIAYPDLEIQEKIASILSALDDKIEINNEMNKTLEEMAQTLFKRWFIDFDFPNENGEPYKSSGGKMVDSELGEIPEGWEVKELESFVEKLSKGTTPTKKDVENATSIEKIPFIKVKDLKDDGEIIMNNLEYISRDISENKLKRSIIKTNDVLFTIAGTIGKVSIVPTTLSNGNLNQAIAFIRLKNLKYREYIYYYLKSKETQNVISSKIVQAVQANVSLSILNNLRVLNPTYEILDSYNLLVKKTFDLYLKNQQEKQSLTEIRDTLLPKLMSGEIEV